MTPRRGAIPARLALWAPWLSLAVLAGLAAVLPNRTIVDEGAEVRMAEVAAAMKAVPFIIGPWVGADDLDAVPPEAQKLLRPNATLARTYQIPGDIGVTVLMVHCQDARDMIGHYPPICYPSSGWVRMDPALEQDLAIDADGIRLPVRMYRFRQMQGPGRDVRIRIFNAFVLPDGTVTPEIDDINKQSERLAVSARGVAQLQVITSEAVDQEVAADAAGEVLGGMAGLFEALRIRGEDGRDA